MRKYVMAGGVGLLCLALLGIDSQGSGPPLKKAKPDDTLVMALKIDRHIAAEYQATKAVPAPAASDAAFARRIYLDLAGRIPRVSEVRAFLDDKRSDKRRKLVDKLLGTSNHVNHFTNVWRTLLLPNNNNQQVQFLSAQIDAWVKPLIRANTNYDKVVRDLLTATIANRMGGFRPVPGGSGQNAVAFYQANEMKPENIAAATSRLFLGVKLECAQCHDHPFAKWTRKQFWEYAAFFGGIKPVNPQAGIFGGANDDPKVREVSIPGSTRKVKARFLDGKQPKWEDN